MSNILRKVKILRKIIQGYIGYKLGLPRPLICSFNVTSRCNLVCSFCPFFGKYGKFRYETNIIQHRYGMTTDEAKYAIDQIEKLGITYLNFNGGEPLLRSDLGELAKFAFEKNIIITLTTNGTLATKELAQSFRGYFDAICVSIHGLKDLDDKFKGKKGAFKKSVEGLKFFKKYSGARVGITFVINKYNYHQIEDILDFAKENCDFISYRPVNFFSEFFLEKKVAQNVGNKLLELKEKNKNFIIFDKHFFQSFSRHLEEEKVLMKCQAFDLSLALGPGGELLGCCYPFVVGNILDSDAKNLLKLGKSKKKELEKRCKEERHFLGCGEYSFLDRPLLKNLPRALRILRKI